MHDTHLFRHLTPLYAGSNQPISLYTYDAVVRNPMETNSKLGVKQSVRTYFDNNPPLHNAIYRNRFNKAVDLYIEGDWNQVGVSSLLAFCLSLTLRLPSSE